MRGQWAIESKYHARRDWAYCEDVRTRRCNENVTGAMLLARSPVFVFLALSGMENCQAFKEELQSDRNRVFRLVTGGTGANAPTTLSQSPYCPSSNLIVPNHSSHTVS